MGFDNLNIIQTAVLGSGQSDSFKRFKVVQNELQKKVLPPIPFVGFRNKTELQTVDNDFTVDNWKATAPLPASDQFFPFYFIGDDGERYLLPYEPFISITGKNVLVRRNVAKAKTKEGVTVGGSIKERWTQGDYEITITGVLIGSILTGSVEDCYPREDFERLRDFMIASTSLKVMCEPLQLLGINQLVIEDFSFPFTKGENVQSYEIKAYSDFDYKLLLEIDD